MQDFCDKIILWQNYSHAASFGNHLVHKFDD